jgi:hypothetical protein
MVNPQIMIEGVVISKIPATPTIEPESGRVLFDTAVAGNAPAVKKQVLKST